MNEDDLSLQVDHARRHMRMLELTQMYAAGVPVQEICDTFHISKSQVLRYARLMGLPQRPRGFDPEVRKKVIALYEAGELITKISALCGVSQAYVSTAAKDAGLPLRHKFEAA